MMMDPALRAKVLKYLYWRKLQAILERGPPVRVYADEEELANMKKCHDK